MKRHSHAWTLVLLLAWYGPVAAGQLSGRVTRSDDGAAVAGALVAIRGTTLVGISDLDGNYAIADIPDGSYGLSCSAPGLRGVSVGATWIDDEATRDFSLDPPAGGGTIQGTVTCAGTPCQGVLVQARQGSNVRGQALSRPTTGAFAIVGLAPGEYELRGLLAGYLPATASVTLPEPATDGGTTSAEQNLALNRGGPFVVSGIVGLSDNPVDKSGSNVRLNGSQPALLASTSTGGAYRLEGVPAGPLSFTAWHQGYRSQTRIDVLVSGDRQLDFVLQKDDGSSGPTTYVVSGTVTLEVPDGGTLPVPGAPTEVAVWSPDGAFQRGVRAGADGSYRISGLLAGSYQAGASREGFVPDTSEAFDLAANRTINFTLALDPDYAGNRADEQLPGCGCTTRPRAAAWPAWLLLLGPLWYRRRRGAH